MKRTDFDDGRSRFIYTCPDLQNNYSSVKSRESSINYLEQINLSGDPGDDLMSVDDIDKTLKLKESLKQINSVLTTILEDSDDMMDSDLGDGSYDKDKLIEELNQIFTPILIQNAMEGDISEEIQEAFHEASLLLERNIIRFDKAGQVSILRATCALVLARSKRTEKYKAWENAQAIANSMKLEIQKEEYDDANNLARQYLSHVSNNNNSDVARDAANNLLPELQK